MSERAVQILISGAVQGCGVRPEFARLAIRNRWSGSVRNTNRGVELILSGLLPDNEEIRRLIVQAIPPQAVIDNVCIESECNARLQGFSIDESTATGIVSALVPCDIAICSDCLAEVRDPRNRRYRYPFTSCARCGPRYSILQSMPFDRARTTMHRFPLCSACLREFQDLADRRFHAQTICCHECGPQVWLSDHKDSRIVSGDDAIRRSAEAILDGQIVAIRGVGGYQILADATNSNAIGRLRERKRRSEKPLAIMCRNLVDAQRLVRFDELESAQLTSTHNPIVLLRQRNNSDLPTEINPGLNLLGILLPTTAMHDRLLELTGRPVICTSGNTNGDPIAFGINEAHRQLSSVADLFLHNDREISHPIDDSVVRIIVGRAVTFRCGRGLAPLSLPIKSQPQLIASGGQLKASIAASNGRRSWLGPYIGDLDVVTVQQRWIEQLKSLDQQEPDDSSERPLELKEHHLNQFAHDAHPEYFSTTWCAGHAANRQAVWHHHAHIVSGMLEHQWLDRTVLGVAFDGTGFGADGTIWGGEFLIATATSFQRIGYLRPFALPGGEASIVDLRRILLSLLSQIDGISDREILELTRLSATDLRRHRQILDSRMTIRSTSCGRIFDAVACLILGMDRSTFEGQAAMTLECCCDSTAEGEYSFVCESTSPFQIDWRPVLTQIVKDRSRAASPGAIAMRFHRGLARTIVELCLRYQGLPVVLSGGVFQNRILVEQISELWPECGSPLGIPGMIPPNDGGLAAGQLSVATMLCEKDRLCAWESPDVSSNGSIATP